MITILIILLAILICSSIFILVGYFHFKETLAEQLSILRQQELAIERIHRNLLKHMKVKQPDD